jgi:hypothetical protein
MAIIHIEKRKNAIWALIAAILIIIGLTWMYIHARKEKKIQEITPTFSLVEKPNSVSQIKFQIIN